jgi:hypothetical protein
MHFFTRDTCATHLLSIDIASLLTFREKCKVLSSSLCNCLLPSITSSLLGPNILLSTLFSTTFKLLISLKTRTKFHTRTKQLVRF